MSDQEKIKLLEEMMELEEGDLTMDTELDELDEWDSLSKLSLMALVKKRTGKTLGVEEVRAFCTIRDICDYLEG